MSRILVKDRRVVVSGGRVLTGDAPCCCDGGGYPCSLFQTTPCWKIRFSGILPNLNHHDLTGNGLDGLVECGAIRRNNSPINILSTTGANRLLTRRTSGSPSTQSFEAQIRVQYPNNQTDVIETVVVSVLTGCGESLNAEYGGVLDDNQIYVTQLVYAMGGFPTPFDDQTPYQSEILFWFKADSTPGSVVLPSPLGVPISNFEGCRLFNSAVAQRKGGVEGFAVVTAEDIPLCDEPDQYAIARECGGSRTIPVDHTTNVNAHPNCYYEGDLFVLTGETTEDDPVAVSWTSDECGTEWPLAVECEGSTQITYDPAQRPQGALTLLVGQARYTPIAGVGTDDPTEGVWTNDPCPDPGGDAIYRVNRCNSTQPARWFDIVNGELVERTIGYRPGDGMAPGEGHVVVNAIEGAGCLHSVGAQPTTIELTDEPDLILTSRTGPCASRPARLVDTRPQCAPQDGGGFDDADNVNLNAQDDANIPQLGDLVEQAIRTITLNTLLPCASCERRKEVLNRYGERIGRAILRRLNW